MELVSCASYTDPITWTDANTASFSTLKVYELTTTAVTIPYNDFIQDCPYCDASFMTYTLETSPATTGLVTLDTSAKTITWSTSNSAHDGTTYDVILKATLPNGEFHTEQF